MTPKPWYSDEGLKFTCTQCGNCCTGPPGYVVFSNEEAKAIAEYLGLSVARFRKRYTRRILGRPSLTEHESPQGYDCVFLERDEVGKALCTIYPVRPAQCRTWPFWKENIQSPGAWKRTTQMCPGSGQGRLYPIEKIRILRDSTPEL